MKISIRKKAIKDLKNINEFLRVGNYRTLFDVEGDEIIIGSILHRKSSYK